MTTFHITIEWLRGVVEIVEFFGNSDVDTGLEDGEENELTGRDNEIENDEEEGQSIDINQSSNGGRKVRMSIKNFPEARISCELIP